MENRPRYLIDRLNFCTWTIVDSQRLESSYVAFIAPLESPVANWVITIARVDDQLGDLYSFEKEMYSLSFYSQAVEFSFWVEPLLDFMQSSNCDIENLVEVVAMYGGTISEPLGFPRPPLSDLH